MSPIPPIDLDSETIQFEGHWFTREDLARRIKAMLDAGDYNVARPSQSLEQLTLTLSGLRTLAVRITPEMAEALNDYAARQSQTAAGLIRELIAAHLGGVLEAPEPEPEPEPAPVKAVSSRRPTDPEMAMAPTPVHAPMPGPGALKAASTERPTLPSILSEEGSLEGAASAVDLPSKKKEDEAIEKRWFGG